MRKVPITDALYTTRHHKCSNNHCHSLEILAGPATLLGEPETDDISDGVDLYLIGAAVGGAAACLGASSWFVRRRRQQQGEDLGAFHLLAERVIGAATVQEIAEQMDEHFPEISRATGVFLYLYNRRTNCLERVPTKAEPEPMAASIGNPPDGVAGTAIKAFLERVELSVPDVRASPLVEIGPKVSLPSAALLVPILSRGPGSEVMGVLEFHCADRTGYFSHEEVASAKHMAGLIAITIQVHQRHAAEAKIEQTGRQAAAGLMMAGLAAELMPPLEEIWRQSALLLQKAQSPDVVSGLRRVSEQAQKAAALSSRLASFAGDEELRVPEPVDLTALLKTLVHVREPQWESQRLTSRVKLESKPAVLRGGTRQLEQVFLQLLMHAENRAQESEGRSLGFTFGVSQGKASIEISYSVPYSSAAKVEENPLSKPGLAAGALGACHDVIASYGGEIRFFSWLGNARLEVNLPSETEPAPESRVVPPASRALTLLLVEPDATERRRLLLALADRGHRVVPAHAEEAADLAQRISIDAVLWAVRSGGARWGDLQDKAGCAVILMSDGYDPELARSLEDRGNFLLKRPCEDQELDRVLTEVSCRAADVKYKSRR